MQYSWQVTEPERHRVLHDSLRVRMTSGQAAALYILYLIILVLAWLIGGWFIVLLFAVFVLLCIAAVAFVWYRQLRGTTWAAYPVGSTATSMIIDDKLRLINAVSSTEIALSQLRKPRTTGSVVSFVLPGSRLRRGSIPRVLLPDEVTSHLR